VITAGAGWVLRHQSGRFLTWEVAAERPGYEFDLAYTLTDHPFDAAIRYFGKPEPTAFLSVAPELWPLDQFEVVRGPACACCGEGYPAHHPAGTIYKVSDGTARCDKHQKRNPCAIEGCKRTTAARQGWYSNDDWLCGEHWRIACPPRSALRRAYHRIWRIKKKLGKWTPELDARYWRLMRGIIARARGRGCGAEDLAAEVAKAMGWAA
jgi:hypothetical protein